MYDAEESSVNNKYLFTLGEESFELDVLPGTKFKPINLGEVILKKGEAELSVKPLILEGAELMKLRSIILTPLK